MCLATSHASGKQFAHSARGQVLEDEQLKAQTTDSNLTLLPVSVNSSYRLLGHTPHSPVSFILDTGVTISLIRRDKWDRVKVEGDDLEPWTGKKLVGAEGTALQIHCVTNIKIMVDGEMFTLRAIVADMLTTEAILGLDFMEANGCVLDTQGKRLRFQGRNLAVQLDRPDATGASEITQVRVSIEETICLPIANSVLLPMASFPARGIWKSPGTHWRRKSMAPGG